MSKKTIKSEDRQPDADLTDMADLDKSDSNQSNSGQSQKPADPAKSGQSIEAVGSDAPESVDQLNRETGVLTWQELVRFFARGVVIKVHPDLDLVEVGRSMSIDDTDAMQSWLDTSLISRASDDDARDWTERQPEFWCLVAAPWVLVQERDLVRENSNERGTVH